MSRFVSELTHSSAKSRGITHRTDGYMWLLLLVALLAYAAPWLINSSVSISPNAYDLADWASLHPASRMTTIPLLTSLFLRLPLVCVALLIALRAIHSVKTRWIALLCVLLIAAALLPPLEFFTSASSDTNYQQQAILSIVTILGGTIAASGIARSVYPLLVFICAFVGIAACIGGLVQGYNLMTQFDIPARVGVGGLALSAIFLAIALIQFRRVRPNTA